MTVRPLRILFLSHYFPPESNAPANRTFEHCREWARLGHEVHVVTGFPSHPRGRLYPGYRKRLYRRERLDGIHVHRVWTYFAANRGRVRRTVNYLSFVPSAVWRALRLGRFDIVIATSPQFFNAVAGWVTSMVKRTPWVFELRDLWPESIVAVGAVDPGVILSSIEKLELTMYARAAKVVCVTQSFMRNLERRGVDATKLVFLPNGVEPEVWRAVEDSRAWRERLGAGSGEITATYVGTVGMAHGIGTVLDAAERLQGSEPRVHFTVVGEGAEREALEADAADRRLRNVTFTGQLARHEIPHVMGASDISLVLLRDAPTFRSVLPSKMFEAMAAGRPVVLGVDGEARRVLEEADGGVFVPPGDANRLAEAVARLAGAPAERRRLGASGQRFVAENYDRRVLARRYLRELRRIVARDTRRSPV